MTYNISYDSTSDPTDIQLDITSITQGLVDFLVANNTLTVVGRNGYNLTINRGGTNILGTFDNGSITLWIAEDADPAQFQTLTGHVYGYVQEDADELTLRVNSVLSEIPTAILPN